MGDGPFAFDDTEVTNVDTPVIMIVIVTEKDIGDGPLIVTEVTDLIPSVIVTYRLDPIFTGTDTFNYAISDVNGGTDTAFVTVTVGYGPFAFDDSEGNMVDTPVIVDVTEIDIGDGPLIVTEATDINSNVTVTYRPDPSFTGTDSFSYTIMWDMNGGTDTAIVAVR